MLEKLPINPWLKMWFSPRETVRGVIGFNSNYMVPLLAAIYGISPLFQAAQNFSLGDKFSLQLIALGVFIGSIFVGLLAINFVSALFYWTGKWIGGVAAFDHIRAAVAWSNMPNFINILIWIINISAFRRALFTKNFTQISFLGGDAILIFLTSLGQVIIAVWVFVLLLNSLSTVQGFSIWKAILNVLMSFFLIFVALSILTWFLGLMTNGLSI